MTTTATAKRRRIRRRAFTLTETMIAASMALLVTGTVMFLTLQVSKELKSSLAQVRVQRKASSLQDRLARELRHMSADEGAIFYAPASLPGAGTVYHGIIVGRGEEIDPLSGLPYVRPKEAFFYDAQDHTLSHILNYDTGEAEVMFDGSETVVLRELHFYQSVTQAGYAPDSSLINVHLEMDDNAKGKRGTDGEFVAQAVKKYFAVKMRSK